MSTLIKDPYSSILRPSDRIFSIERQVVTGRKKPRVKVPRYPGSFRKFLTVPIPDLGKYSLREMGITDVVFSVPNDLMWSPIKTDNDVRKHIEMVKSKTEGLDLWAFYWSFGPTNQVQNIWANSPVDPNAYSRFIGRVKLLTELGMTGHILDTEDEGRLAKRDRVTGVVTNPWWPKSSLIPARSREFAEAVGDCHLGIYTIFWMQLQTTGVHMNLDPVRIPAHSFFPFVNNLGRPYFLFSGDTFGAAESNYIKEVYKRVTTEPGYSLNKKGMTFVPGTWFAILKPTLGPYRMKMSTSAREMTNIWWGYQDFQYFVREVGQREQLSNLLK